MNFIVEFQLKPGTKEHAVAVFEQRGPNRHPGVSFKGAWIGSRSDIAFVLVDGVDEAEVARVARTWAAFGETKIHPVIDLQLF